MNVLPIVHQLCTDTSCLHGGSCGNRSCVCAENWKEKNIWHKL